MPASSALPSTSDNPRSSAPSVALIRSATSSTAPGVPSSAVICSMIHARMASSLKLMVPSPHRSRRELSTILGLETPCLGRPGHRASNLAYHASSSHEFAPRSSRGKAATSPIDRAAAAVAAILVREGIDYAQSEAVIKAARARAGLRAPPERRGAIDRLTVEEELRILDQAYARGGRTGLMLQTLLETGARASEFVRLRVEDVSLAERVIVIPRGKGGRRSEVPIRREMAQLLQLHIGARRAGPLFQSRQRGTGPTPHVYTRQRVGQIVREVAREAGVAKRVHPPRWCNLTSGNSPCRGTAIRAVGRTPCGSDRLHSGFLDLGREEPDAGSPR